MNSSTTHSELRDESPSSGPQMHGHSAIVSRVLHGHLRLRPLIEWLATPATGSRPPLAYRNTEITQTIAELLGPITADATPWERRQSAHAAEWLTALAIEFERSQQIYSLDLARPMLASVMLPLYRSLATGSLAESMAAMAQQAAEHLVLLALLDELGNEFPSWLESQILRNKSPRQALAEGLHQDLSDIARLLLDAACEFEHESGALTANGRSLLQGWQADETEKHTQPPQWADSQLLWKLARELIATRSEMVLPRPWIEIHVPWSQIQGHWHQLSHQLNQLPSSLANTIAEPPVVSSSQSFSETDELEDLLETIATVVDENHPPLNLSTKAEAAVDSTATNRNSKERTSSLKTESEPTIATTAPTAETTPPITECLPKMMLAEISGMQDPAFVNVMRRRLAACRADDRPLCVSIVVVTPDDELAPVSNWEQTSCLSRWQQSLVNWLAEQPHVVEPFAFLTSVGELIFCVHDLEKNEMTTLIRRALVRVLGGESDVSASDTTLSKVSIPARFHAGIAGTSSPGPNLTAEQLIAPAIRCLQAAQHQGKTGIKSIEVY